MSNEPSKTKTGTASDIERLVIAHIGKAMADVAAVEACPDALSSRELRDAARLWAALTDILSQASVACAFLASRLHKLADLKVDALMRAAAVKEAGAGAAGEDDV